MHKYNLKIYPDAVLRHKAYPVKEMNGEIYALIEAMKDIMYTHQGIGLAVPQLGILNRIIIADIGEGLIALANPMISKKEGTDNLKEGCLSLPGVNVDINRYLTILIKGINPEGEELKMELTGLTARVVQHEVDHLNGVLIIDHQQKKPNAWQHP